MALSLGSCLVFVMIMLNSWSGCSGNKVHQLTDPVSVLSIELPQRLVPLASFTTLIGNELTILSNDIAYQYDLGSTSEKPIDSIKVEGLDRAEDISEMSGGVLFFNYSKSVVGYYDSTSMEARTWPNSFQHGGNEYYITSGADMQAHLSNDTLVAYAFQKKVDIFEQYKNSAAFKLVLDSSGILRPIEKLFGFHPSYSKANFTRSVRPLLTFAEGQMIYAYNSIDSIYVQEYNGSVKAIHVDIEGWRDPDVFPVDKLDDYTFTEKYLAEQPQLKLFVYNEKVKKLYLIVKLPNTYEKPDGTLELFQDGHWSIISFNDKFEQLSQYEFPGVGYHNELVIPYKNGLLLGLSGAAIGANELKLEYHEGI